jgi:hypothetical protein
LKGVELGKGEKSMNICEYCGSGEISSKGTCGKCGAPSYTPKIISTKIEDNFVEQDRSSGKVATVFPIKVTCCECRSTISFEKKDIGYGRCNRTWSTNRYQLSVKCPFCGELEDVEGDLDYFTRQEFKYPKLNFWETDPVVIFIIAMVCLVILGLASLYNL